MARYRVRRGDSFLSLAQQYGTTAQNLSRLNPGVSRLSAGMGIRIPGAGRDAGTGVGLTRKDAAQLGVSNWNAGRGGEPLRPVRPGEVIQTSDSMSSRRAVTYNGDIVRIGPSSIFDTRPQQQTGFWQNLWTILNGGSTEPPVPSGVLGVQGSLPGGHNALMLPSGQQGITGTSGGTKPAPGSFQASPFYAPLAAIDRGAQAVADAFQRGAGGNYPGIPGQPYNTSMGEGSQGGYGSGFKSPNTFSPGEGARGGYNETSNYAYALSQGQPITMSQFLAIGGTPEEAAQMGGLVIQDQGQAPVQPAPGTRTRTANGGTIIQGQNTPSGQGQYAYINPYARGQHWRVTTYKDENGNWVKATVPDYGGTRRNYRRGSLNKGGGGGNAGFGLVNFSAGSG